jgi:Tol biopolymer transport system component/predicted Ser/Thr protein kinase
MSTPQRIGAYPIERELGRGGMGIVYLGRDPRLDRPVAIKVLPELFARDPERLARFEREARLLASLNHPNIAGIYGIEEAGGHRFLALEYVEGETLGERLMRGPMSVDEALEIARQIAAALEAAHEAGIVHRDLKPGNVKLTSAGEVKVLDFGLAKGGAESPDSNPDLSRSPTMAMATTGAGVILGTAAYMSPEQARGKSVDRRTDIWSFGCVLYECLTRRQLFTGETVSDMIARILEREPDWDALPAALPEKIRELLRRCLEKDAKRRLRDIGDARLELEEALAARTTASRAAAAEKERVGAARAALPATAAFAWAIAVTALLVAATAIVLPTLIGRGSGGETSRLSVLAPEGKTLFDDDVMSALSPDGRTLAFVATDSSGSGQLWVRPLGSLIARPLAGTTEAFWPFWSADSRSLGFFADGKLKTVPVAGGGVEEVCAAQSGRGGTWNHDNVIVFAAAGEGPLYRVAASGGNSQPVTALDTTRHETAHRFPCFLPDGKHFLYVALPSRAGKFEVFAGALDSPRRQAILEAAGAPIYAAPGYLVYLRNNVLVAQRFDVGRLRTVGEPVPLPDAPGVSQLAGYRAATASDAGTLAYLNGHATNTRVEWLERSGAVRRVLALPEGQYSSIGVSPDGKSAVVSRAGGPGESDLFLFDLERVVATRFTYGPGENDTPVWSPEGSRIAFESNRSGVWNLYVKPATGASLEVPLVESPAQFKHAWAWSSDGQRVCFYQLGAKTGWDLWTIAATGGAKPEVYLQTPFDEMFGSISPDGHWMSYASNESGRFEVYVQSYPTPGNKYRVSTTGGVAPVWRKDGREILFGAADGLTSMAVDVVPGPVFRSGTPHALGRVPAGWTGYAAFPDARGFLVSVPAGGSPTGSITVVQNWAAGLGKQ